MAAQDIINAYEAILGRKPDETEIRTALENEQRRPGEEEGHNALLRELHERAAPTASAGGRGGDADVDNDGRIDPGWAKNAGGQYARIAAQAPPQTATSTGGAMGNGGTWWDQAAASMGSFGAAPEPFGETYAPLARPSHLQGEYIPGQWSETFAAPAKPSVLQTPYMLPTQAELEASPGYLSGQSAMQRGMERSAAAKGTVLSGGFVGRALPRAMGEYAGTAYGNLVNQTLGARQQQHGEYSTDVSHAFQQYQQRYGQFADAEGLKLGARNVNEAAFQGDQAAHTTGYNTRYGAYLDKAGMKRQAENDLWSRNRDVSDMALRAAALARP